MIVRKYMNTVHIFPLTGLFKSSLHPLGQPAQVTVTVQGVGAQSTNERRAITVRTRTSRAVQRD